MTTTRSLATVALAAAGALALSACSSANGDGTDYPTRAIDLTIPFGAGGATDLAARALADGLSDELGQPINPTNRPGANQVTAVSQVLGAGPDGYTLLADGGGSSTIQSLATELPYEWDDRTFIAQVASGGHAYAVSAGSGITTLDALADEATADPAGFDVAWLGGTSTSDFAALQFLDAAGVDPGDVNLVPFTSSGDAMQAAAAGDVDLATGGSSAVAALHSSGDLVPLALTSPDPNLPDLPLTADEGYPELDMRYWVGLSGPGELPEDVVTTLADAVTTLEADADLEESFGQLGMNLDVVTGEELQGRIEDEAELFAELDDLGR